MVTVSLRPYHKGLTLEAHGLCFLDPLGLNMIGQLVSSVQVLGGLGLVVGGNALGIATSWTGVGAVVGFGIVALGVDQALAGVRNLANSANDIPISDSTAVKEIYRSISREVTGYSGSSMEVTLDALYGSAEIASSCYGAIITVQSVMRSVRMTYIPAHTVKQAIIENGTIHWQFHLEASCWKLEGGGVIFHGVYDLIIDAASNLDPNTSNDDMGQ